MVPRGHAVEPPRYSRPQALFLPGEPLCCPSGHRLASSMVALAPGHVLRQCRYREMRERDRVAGFACPNWLWIYTHENGSHTVIWVAESEADAIVKNNMLPYEARDYLGLMWPHFVNHRQEQFLIDERGGHGGSNEG